MYQLKLYHPDDPPWLCSTVPARAELKKEQIPRNLRAYMRKAMDYITRLTPCITFVPAVSASPNFVMIVPGQNCSSEVGIRGGEQLLYMNSACCDRGGGLIVPVHLLMHTLGFLHEHNRTLVLAGSCFVLG